MEKGRLVEALPPAGEGGIAILNYDDPRVRAMASRTQARVVTYGLDPDADLVAGAVEADHEGISFTVFVKDFFPVSGWRGRRRHWCWLRRISVDGNAGRWWRPGVWGASGRQ